MKTSGCSYFSLTHRMASKTASNLEIFWSLLFFLKIGEKLLRLLVSLAILPSRTEFRFWHLDFATNLWEIWDASLWEVWDTFRKRIPKRVIWVTNTLYFAVYKGVFPFPVYKFIQFVTRATNSCLFFRKKKCYCEHNFSCATLTNLSMRFLRTVLRDYAEKFPSVLVVVLLVVHPNFALIGLE